MAIEQNSAELSLLANRAKGRRHYERHREATKRKVAERKLSRKADPIAAEHDRTWRREHKRKLTAALRAKGLNCRGNGPAGTSQTISFERQQTRLTELNARQAWQWWLRRAPNRWMRAYYRSLGRPWLNPRLSDADKWRIQYWLDPLFRANEIEKVQRLKLKRASLMAKTDDGTLTGKVIVALYAAAKICPYCDTRMRSVEKTLDHVVALTCGGAHSIRNVLICCGRCNNKKARKSLDVWLKQTGKECTDYFRRFLLTIATPVI